MAKRKAKVRVTPVEWRVEVGGETVGWVAHDRLAQPCYEALRTGVWGLEAATRHPTRAAAVAALVRAAKEIK